MGTREAKSFSAHGGMLINLIMQMWRILAGTRAKMMTQPAYYGCLVRLADPGLADIENIIMLDVKRTPQAKASPEFADQLTRVLTAYAKYVLANRQERWQSRVLPGIQRHCGLFPH